MSQLSPAEKGQVYSESYPSAQPTYSAVNDQSRSLREFKPGISVPPIERRLTRTHAEPMTAMDEQLDWPELAGCRGTPVAGSE